jgi:hypothetical protein
VRLPADMLETARTVGLRSTALSKYISLQVSLGGVSAQTLEQPACSTGGADTRLT